LFSGILKAGKEVGYGTGKASLLFSQKTSSAFKIFTPEFSGDFFWKN
jgi:hypothetical protein